MKTKMHRWVTMSAVDILHPHRKREFFIGLLRITKRYGMYIVIAVTATIAVAVVWGMLTLGMCWAACE